MRNRIYIFLALSILLMFIFNIFSKEIKAQQSFSLVFTYDFNDYGNDIFAGTEYSGKYYLTQISLYFQKKYSFLFLSSKFTFQFYYPLIDKSLDLIWVNPSISFLAGVYSDNQNSNVIIKIGFFILLAYPYIELNDEIKLNKKLIIGEGPFFSLGIKLKDNINLVFNLIFQTDLTSLFGNYFFFLDYTNFSIGLEFYL